MAINKTTLLDEDLAYSDWIELQNTSDQVIDLGGWYLTDDATNLTQWQFPSTNIAPGEFLLIFASDKNRSVAGSELHTNFKLSGDGEYLALVHSDATTIVHEFSPEYPPQQEDVSYGYAGGNTNVALVAGEANCTAFVPADASDETQWIFTNYDDGDWATGTTGVGYDTGTRYESLLDVDLQSAMYGNNASAYIRIPFVANEISKVTELSLRMKYDDGFVAYLNGVRVASANAPVSVVWDSRATTYHNDSDAEQFVEFDLSASLDTLVEGENLLAIHALNENSSSSDLLIFPELNAWMVLPESNETLGYLHVPTPGEVNGAGSIPASEPVVSSRLGGVFLNPVVVELSATNSADGILYTLDGSEPSETSSVYTEPLTLSSTTLLRARTFKTSYALGPIYSETYLFLANDDIRTFSSGLPIVVVDNLGDGDISDNKKDPAFLSIFEPGLNGRTSLTNGYSIGTRAGIRRRGESSLRPTSRKPNLAIETWADGADESSNIAPFNMPAESDWILWAPYTYDSAGIRNSLIYELSNQTKNYAVRTRFVEVFLNHTGGALSSSDYVGLYIFEEKIKRDNDRVDIEKMGPLDNDEPAVSGGYLLSIDKNGSNKTPISGVVQPHLSCIDPSSSKLTAQQNSYIQNFMIDFEAQLHNSNPVTGYPKYIDQPSFIDHNMLNMLTKNIDGLRISTFMYKPRNGKLHMGPIWDFDRSMESTDRRDNTPTTWNCTGDGTRYIEPMNVYGYWAYWWGELFKNADFWQLYVDRWQELRKNTFSDINLWATIDGMAAEIAEAKERDISRWQGTSGYASPRTGSNGLDGTQQGEINHLKWWLSERTAWLDDQFIDLPVFSHAGGEISNSIMLSITVPAGTTIYYTVDGSDPRALGGAPSATAIIYTEPFLVAPHSIIQARAWNGESWTENAPAEAPWSGLEKAVFVSAVPELLLTEVHYNPEAPAVGIPYGNDDFEFLELQCSSTNALDLNGYKLDGGIEFSFSQSAVSTLQPGEYVVVVRNLAAFASRYTTNGMHIAGEYSGKLSNSGENIRLEYYGKKIFDVTFDDARGWPVATDGGGHSLIPNNEKIAEQGFDILDYPGNWRASTYIGGSPGIADPEPPISILINELTAHTDTGLAPPFDSNDHIELYNPTTTPFVLDGHWFLSDNVLVSEKWNIPEGTIVPANGWVVFNEDDFHPNRTTGFGLDKAGEQVVLSYRPGNALDRIVDSVSFKGQLNGLSLGRYPDGDAFFQTLAFTPGTANQLPDPEIWIQELMYHPAPMPGHDADADLEYVMLTNRATYTIEFTDSETLRSWRINGGIDYVFETNTFITAGEALWLVPFDPVLEPDKKAFFCSVYELDPTATRLLGPYSGELSNTGERIALERPQASDVPLFPEDISWILVDEVIWLDEAPWPSKADGLGWSLVRTGSAGNDPQSWETLGNNDSPPVWNVALPIDGGEVSINTPYSGSLAGQAYDPNGNEIVYGKDGGPAWLSVASDGALSGTAPVMSGTNTFTVTASDGTNSTPATLNIIVQPSFSPVWREDPIDGGTVWINTSYNGSLADKAYDPDGNTIIYSKATGPAWLSVAPDGTLSGTSPSTVETSVFVIVADDGNDPSTQATLNILVREPPAGLIQSDPGVTTASGGGNTLVRIDESNDSDDWITSINSNGGTIYIGFDWTITDNAGETGGGGFYGGLELYEGSTERLLIGNDWSSVNYSFGGPGFGEVSAIEYTVGTPMRLVCKLEMVVDGNDSAFLFVNQESEGTPDVSLIRDYNFNRLVHRTGNNSGESDLENLIIATTYAAAYGGKEKDPIPVADLVIQGPVSAGTEMILIWTAEDGRTYGVQTNADLVAGSWGSITHGLKVIGGGTLTYTNAVGLGKIFYQVISE